MVADKLAEEWRLFAYGLTNKVPSGPPPPNMIPELISIAMINEQLAALLKRYGIEVQKIELKSERKFAKIGKKRGAVSHKVFAARARLYERGRGGFAGMSTRVGASATTGTAVIAPRQGVNVTRSTVTPRQSFRERLNIANRAEAEPTLYAPRVRVEV